MATTRDLQAWRAQRATPPTLAHDELDGALALLSLVRATALQAGLHAVAARTSEVHQLLAWVAAELTGPPDLVVLHDQRDVAAATAG